MDSIFSQSITDIGQVLGYPALLLIGWLYYKVKDLEKRLQDGNGRFDRIEAELSSVNKTLSEIVGSLNTLIKLKESNGVRTFDDVVRREG